MKYWLFCLNFSFVYAIWVFFIPSHNKKLVLCNMNQKLEKPISHISLSDVGSILLTFVVTFSTVWVMHSNHLIFIILRNYVTPSKVHKETYQLLEFTTQFTSESLPEKTSSWEASKKLWLIMSCGLSFILWSSGPKYPQNFLLLMSSRTRFCMPMVEDQWFLPILKPI